MNRAAYLKAGWKAGKRQKYVRLGLKMVAGWFPLGTTVYYVGICL